ncbi:hypothetical protein IT411_02430 [Candidatus Peregrinibacteria bacterium]|nr:hypothetical protein [Candidatus Peregrinibacteria bacterium]
MANTSARQKLDEIIANSKVFKLLDKLDQSNFLAELEKANDEQILATIQAIEEEESQLAILQKRKLEIAQKQIELSESLHHEIKLAERDLAKAEESAEKQASVTVLQKMENEINQIDTNSTSISAQKEKKKFLGLF